MIIKKEIEVGIDIQDPINFYSNDNIEYYIKSKYEKRCFKGCYIITVDKILLQSDCVISQESNDGSATLNVLFSATVLVYSEGEILSNCTVVRIDKKSGIIICETDIAYIMLRRTNIFESLKLKQIISVFVGKSKYAPGSDKIAINGIPFLPVKNNVYYLCNDGSSEGSKGSSSGSSSGNNNITFNYYVEKIKEEAVLAKNYMGKKSWITFSKLVSVAKVSTNPIMLEHFAADKAKYVGKLVSRGSNVILTDPVVCIHRHDEINVGNVGDNGDDNGDNGDDNGDDNVSDNANIIVSDMSIDDIIILMYSDYYNYIKMIREMCEIYKTPALLLEHKNLWTIYNSRK